MRTVHEYMDELAVSRCESADTFLASRTFPNGVERVDMTLVFDDGAIMEAGANLEPGCGCAVDKPPSQKTDTYCGIAAVVLMAFVVGWWLRAVTS